MINRPGRLASKKSKIKDCWVSTLLSWIEKKKNTNDHYLSLVEILGLSIFSILICVLNPMFVVPWSVKALTVFRRFVVN